MTSYAGMVLSDIGLEVNLTKSEVSNVSCDNLQSVFLAIISALPGITVTERKDLGAPVDINGCRTGMLKVVERLSAMSGWLKYIDAHPAFFLRNCLLIPCLLFKLRTSPCYRLHSELTQFNETLQQAASTVCNVYFDDTGWQQSLLPVAQGGLGFSSTVNVSLPAYASSISATRQIVGQILQDVFESCPKSDVDSVAEHWTELGLQPIVTDKKPFHRFWSSAVHDALFHSLKAGAPPSLLDRILTAAQGHPGYWITAYPMAHVGTRLDDKALQISAALRVGLNVCLAHQCRCGATVQSVGFHAISVLVDFPDAPRSPTS